MSSIYSSVAIVDIFDYIVDSIRDTGVVSGGIIDGVFVVNSANKFKQGDIVTIGANQYEILQATENDFAVTDDGQISVGQDWKALAPYYMFGHGLEIANKLNAIDEATELLKYQKYPLIALILDIDEHYGEKAVYCEIRPTILVLNITQQEIYVEDRYENNFKPVIYPIYNNFMKAIDMSGLFFPDYNWTATDRPLLGSQRDGRNMLNDFIDCREIKLNLKISGSIITACKNKNIPIIK